MEVIVHDLLRLRSPGDLLSRDRVPEWASDALVRAPWVVVRRAEVECETIPIGVRGQSRSERFAAFVHSSSIVECVRPQDLTSSEAWTRAIRREELPVMRALCKVHATLRTFDLSWGPVGSVAFELASGFPITHRTSDLDLIVRRRDFLIPPVTVRTLLALVEGIGVRMDFLLETAEGAVSLLEYARGESNLVLRSARGPRLIPHPQGKIYRRPGLSTGRSR
jgi:phosphoribosyl-dephospho-CoA transferase